MDGGSFLFSFQHDVISQRCYKWYTSDPIDQGDDGMDEQCRWCGEGGKLILCDFCHNAFCKNCIRHNLGRPELKSILESGRWSLKPNYYLLFNNYDSLSEYFCKMLGLSQTLELQIFFHLGSLNNWMIIDSFVLKPNTRF